MEETPGKYRTSHQFSGKKGTTKKKIIIGTSTKASGRTKCGLF